MVWCGVGVFNSRVEILLRFAQRCGCPYIPREGWSYLYQVQGLFSPGFHLAFIVCPECPASSNGMWPTSRKWPREIFFKILRSVVSFRGRAHRQCMSHIMASFEEIALFQKCRVYYSYVGL